MNLSISTVHSDVAYPCLIRPARYRGTYSRAGWHAWPVGKETLVPDEAYGSDPVCAQFWAQQEKRGVPLVGLGQDPSEAHGDLVQKLEEKGLTLRSDVDPSEVPGISWYIT